MPLTAVRNRNRVVSKDDLPDVVRDGGVVSEPALTSRINAAWHAVGDSGARQCTIHTVPRKGFRFVADEVPAQSSCAPWRAPLRPG